MINVSYCIGTRMPRSRARRCRRWRGCAFACASGEIVGGFVFRIQIAPIAGGMAIEEGGEERVGNGGGDSGRGDNAAEVVEHGCSVAGESRRGKGRGHGRPRLMQREGLSACGLGKELLNPDPVPLQKDQGGD